MASNTIVIGTGHSHAALTKNACVNWGLAAVVWLIAGKIVERVVRPRTA